MKSLLLLAFFIGAAVAAGLPRGRPDLDNDWKSFKQQHGKKYKDGADEAARRALWEQKHDRINKHNQEAAKGLHTFTMGHNELSDRTEAEVQQLLGARLPANIRQEPTSHWEPETRQTLPASFDLSNSSCMPTVKNQGQCGSCWAFGATTPVEFLTCNKTKTPTLLSESQLVNCSSAQGNSGCNGGWYDRAWNYIRVAPGQAKSSVLPYYPASGACKYNHATMKAATVTSYTRLSNSSTTIMQALVSKGPIAVALWVNSTTFNSYRSGVYFEPTCPNNCYTNNKVNHAVVLVGYGTSTTNIPFWIVRNSWGASWGMAGYFRIRRGVNACNIECYGYSVTL